MTEKKITPRERFMAEVAAAHAQKEEANTAQVPFTEANEREHATEHAAALESSEAKPAKKKRTAKKKS